MRRFWGQVKSVVFSSEAILGLVYDMNRRLEPLSSVSFIEKGRPGKGVFLGLLSIYIGRHMI